MLILNIQLFGGRGSSSNRNSRMNFTTKKIIKLTKDLTIPKGTKITNVVEIAGGKRKRKIDDIKRLLKQYGGNENEWSKRRATAIVDGKKIEIHYYQNDKLGKFDYKKK